jgi:hypothetical protein
MKEFKGTKGDWKIIKGGFSKKDSSPNIFQIFAANEDLEMICIVKEDKILHNRVQDHNANAQIISAAPDLLRQLQLARIDLVEWGYALDSQRIVSIDNAINKALGL